MPDAAEAARPMHSDDLRIALSGVRWSRTERSYRRGQISKVELRASGSTHDGRTADGSSGN